MIQVPARLLRWVGKRLPKREIRDRADVNTYLTRHFVFGSRDGGVSPREGSRLAVYLHQMHRPDDDSCHHDHPWSFFTLVLSGGYVEEITLPRGRIKTRWNRPGTFLWRPADHTHRIEALPTGECWTLVLRLQRRRSWGFHTPIGWIYWRKFIEERDGVQWCDGWDREGLGSRPAESEGLGSRPASENGP